VRGFADHHKMRFRSRGTALSIRVMNVKRSRVRIWRGVRTRCVEASADPESPPRRVTLPASWEQGAADALAALAPGRRDVTLEEAAEAWIGPIASRALRAGIDTPLADMLHRMLLDRRGTPCAPLWRGVGTDTPGFVLNLAAFNEPGNGLDIAGLLDAATTAAIALTVLEPGAKRLAIGIADLAGLLACLGLDYDSDDARAVGAAIAALVRAGADLGSAAMAERFGALARGGPVRAPPAATVIPCLAAAATAAQQAAANRPARRHAATVAIFPAGAAASPPRFPRSTPMVASRAPLAPCSRRAAFRATRRWRRCCRAGTSRPSRRVPRRIGPCATPSPRIFIRCRIL
jgi:hypothetical protein